MTQSKQTSDTPKTTPASSSDAPKSDTAEAKAASSKETAAKDAAKAKPTASAKPEEKKTDAKASAAKDTPKKAEAAKSDAPKNGAANGANGKSANGSDKAEPSKAGFVGQGSGTAPAGTPSETSSTNGSAASASSEPAKPAPRVEPAPAPKPSVAVQTSEPKSGGAGFVTLLIAALLGGVIVFFLGRSFGPGGGTDEGVVARIDALQTRLDQVELATNDPNVANSIRTEIEAVKTRITELQGLQRQVDRLAEENVTSATRTPDFGTSTDLRALEGGVTEVNDAIRSIESRVAQFTGEVTRNEARLRARVDSLESRTPLDLPSQLEAKADTESVETLQGRVTALEENDVARDAHRAAMAVALANLTRATQDSGSFAAEIDAIEILVPEDELMTSLRSYADQGLPSAGVLENRFVAVSRDIVRADRAENGSSFLGRLWANLMASISVRPTGNVQGTSTNAVLARTENNLSEGNLAGAVSELDALDGAAARAASPWLSQARARLHLDELISELNTRVIAGISADTTRVISPARRVAPVETAPTETAPATDGAAPETAPETQANPASESGSI